MYTFVGMTAVFIYALPFIVVSSATLMAKFTDESQQSTIQGELFFPYRINLFRKMYLSNIIPLAFEMPRNKNGSTLEIRLF